MHSLPTKALGFAGKDVEGPRRWVRAYAIIGNCAFLSKYAYLYADFDFTNRKSTYVWLVMGPPLKLAQYISLLDYCQQAAFI